MGIPTSKLSHTLMTIPITTSWGTYLFISDDRFIRLLASIMTNLCLLVQIHFVGCWMATESWFVTSKEKEDEVLYDYE